MFFLRILTPFLLIVKGQQYCISKTNSTESTATEICDLAIPMYSVIGENYGVRLNDGPAGSYWVGYLETAFSYRGCAMTNDLNFSSETIREANPSTCYFSCNSASMFIGILKTNNEVTCYCLHQDPVDSVLKQGQCNTKCTFPNNTLCGGSNKVSVYQKVEYPQTTSKPIETVQTEPKHCLAYEPTYMSFFWAACSSSYRSVCEDTNKRLVIDTLSSGTWIEVIQHCQRNNEMLPVPSTANFSSIATGNGQLWTSTIRSFSTCEQTSNHCPDRQGYIKQKNESTNIYTLEFSYNGTLHALCDKGGNDCLVLTDITVVTTTAGTTTHAANTSAIITATTTASTVSSDESSTKVYNTTTNASQSAEDGSPGAGSRATGGKSNLVGAYVAVPLVLILIAAVIGLVLRRRRTRPSSEKSTNKETEINGGTLGDGLGTAISNSAYEGKDTVRRDYFVLEPTNEYAAIKDTDIAQVSTDEEYNTITAVHAKANGGIGTGNIYNRLDEVIDDTYNHCDTITLVSDDTYSHIEGGKKSSNSLGMISAGMSGANDTYDHVTTKTPSVNALLVKPEKDQTDITEDEDTYNHTGAFDAKSPERAFKSDSSRKPVTQTIDKKLSKDVNGRPNYDYAYTTAAKGKDAKQQGMFTLNQLPNSGDYEFAKEAQSTSIGYENANPTPIYLELNEDQI